MSAPLPPRENPRRSMQSYYFRFEATGESAIDDVLQAVRDAGKRFHHTQSWTDDDNGESCEEAIQRAADEGATEIAALRRLAAPLAPEVVAVLAAAEVMTNSGYHPEYFDDQDDAVEKWIAAGRPGLEKT